MAQKIKLPFNLATEKNVEIDMVVVIQSNTFKKNTIIHPIQCSREKY